MTFSRGMAILEPTPSVPGELGEITSGALPSGCKEVTYETWWRDGATAAAAATEEREWVLSRCRPIGSARILAHLAGLRKAGNVGLWRAVLGNSSNEASRSPLFAEFFVPFSPSCGTSCWSTIG